MRSVREADRGGGARNLFHRNDMREIAHSCATVLFADSDSEHSQVSQFVPQVDGKFISLVDRRSARRDLCRSEARNRQTKRNKRFVKAKIKRGKGSHSVNVSVKYQAAAERFSSSARHCF